MPRGNASFFLGDAAFLGDVLTGQLLQQVEVGVHAVDELVARPSGPPPISTAICHGRSVVGKTYREADVLLRVYRLLAQAPSFQRAQVGRLTQQLPHVLCLDRALGHVGRDFTLA